MWALGILLYQLTTKTHPFDTSNNLKLRQDIKDNKPKNLPKGVSITIRYLIDVLLQKDPKSRSDAATIL
jgi:serine/threonine protein kinase